MYNPPWTKSNIIISEVFSELPLHVMHPYAETILDSLKPSRCAFFIWCISNSIITMIKSVSLLDSYSVPTYATAHPVPIHDTPIRYLTTSLQHQNFLVSTLHLRFWIYIKRSPHFHHQRITRQIYSNHPISYNQPPLPFSQYSVSKASSEH